MSDTDQKKDRPDLGAAFIATNKKTPQSCDMSGTIVVDGVKHKFGAYKQKASGKGKLPEGKGGKPESFEAQYKRRLVKTTKPEHKEKGYNWRIKGKDRPEISIKLYKSKPGQAEFNKQLRRVAGHEFGG